MKRWPHRQLSGLNRAVSHLEAKQEASGDPVIADQLRQLYSRRDVVIDVRKMLMVAVRGKGGGVPISCAGVSGGGGRGA